MIELSASVLKAYFYIDTGWLKQKDGKRQSCQDFSTGTRQEHVSLRNMANVIPPTPACDDSHVCVLVLNQYAPLPQQRSYLTLCCACSTQHQTKTSAHQTAVTRYCRHPIQHCRGFRGATEAMRTSQGHQNETSKGAVGRVGSFAGMAYSGQY